MSIATMLVVLFSIVVYASTVTAVYVINKLRKEGMDKQVEGMGKWGSRWVRFSVILFLILNVLFLITPVVRIFI